MKLTQVDGQQDPGILLSAPSPIFKLKEQVSMVKVFFGCLGWNPGSHAHMSSTILIELFSKLSIIFVMS